VLLDTSYTALKLALGALVWFPCGGIVGLNAGRAGHFFVVKKTIKKFSLNLEG
jgi:hypothetical protein